MPAERLSMRKIKEVLRLSWGGRLSSRAVARSCGIGRTTVREYLYRANEAGLGWPLPEGMTDGELEELLFDLRAPGRGAGARPLPDWGYVHGELKRKGVTLFLLWEEYKSVHPEGYEYSRFCDLHREWAGKLPVWMRQSHKAGEKLFVDYAGMTMPVVDPETGMAREAQIFVAAMGASNYTYAEGTWTQGTPDFLASHVRAFEFFGGVAEILVPDNLKTGVTTPCRYDPDVNPSYYDYVLFRLMCCRRLRGSIGQVFMSAGPHNLCVECSHKLFKKVIRFGSFRHRLKIVSLVISQRARALAFISVSTSAYMWVVSKDAWPSHARIVLMSTPARSR